MLDQTLIFKSQANTFKNVTYNLEAFKKFTK